MNIDYQKLKEALNIPINFKIKANRTLNGYSVVILHETKPSHIQKEIQNQCLLLYWGSDSRDYYICLKCRKPIPRKRINFHHIVFRSAGGLDDPDNLVPICMHCHVGDNGIHNHKWVITDVISHKKYEELKLRYATKN